VARKKKSKKPKKAEGEKNPPAEVTASATSEGEGDGPAPEKAPPKPKKKRARKKAEKKGGEKKAEKGDGGEKKKSEKKKSGRKKKGADGSAAAEPPLEKEPAPEPESEAPPPEAEVVDVDPDADRTLDPEALVAEVAVLAEVAAGEQAAIPIDEPEEAAVPVEDIDAVLDDDETEDLAALIAQTVAGTEPEEHRAEEPLESLDDAVVPGGVEEGRGSPAAPVEAAAPSEPAAAAPVAPTEDGVELEEDIDLTGAIDLGPEITPEIRDRLLAQALAHAELQDARYRVPYADPRPAGRWKALVATGLILVAGILLAAPPSWVRPDPPAQLDAEGRARALRTALLLQSQQVDAYRVRNQRLPESLDELPQRISGLRYVRSGSRAYQIIAYEPDGNAIVYDSSNPSSEFGRLARAFVPGEAP